MYVLELWGETGKKPKENSKRSSRMGTWKRK
jgi:hypothetical protein